jgi:hypothetical protein
MMSEDICAFSGYVWNCRPYYQLSYEFVKVVSELILCQNPITDFEKAQRSSIIWSRTSGM